MNPLLEEAFEPLIKYLKTLAEVTPTLAPKLFQLLLPMLVPNKMPPAASVSKLIRVLYELVSSPANLDIMLEQKGLPYLSTAVQSRLESREQAQLIQRTVHALTLLTRLSLLF